MQKFLSFIVILLSFEGLGQNAKVAMLDTSLNSQWTRLAKDWRYQKGDDLNWAKPEFDDTLWPSMESNNLNNAAEGPVAGKHEIAWFRKRLRVDSNLMDALVLQIFQTGASEIYLDGKLIHKLGKISKNPAEVVYYKPQNNLVYFPLQTKEQVLAIRFYNDVEKYPVYPRTNGYVSLLVTSLSNSYSKDIKRNEQIVSVNTLIYRYYITLGVSIFLCVLFASLFFFFPSEKVNGYFALSSLFLTLFISFVLFSIQTNGKTFWIDFIWSLCSTFQILLLLYCVYKIFNRSFGLLFWLILAAGFISVPLLFLIRPDIISPVMGVLGIFEIIRINILSLKLNKIRTLIFLTFAGVNLVFWLVLL